MNKLSIILFTALVALAACTKSKEVHPEIGDGNDEIVTVGMKDVHVTYARTDHAELSRVVFHYSLAQVQRFEAAEMTKQETFFELTLNDLLSDTLYDYYYELFYSGGESPKTEQKTFHTQAFVAPEPPEPPTPPTPPVPSVPEGAINGLFSVSPSKKVYFSQGNLQYQASSNTWRFAEHQWNCVGGTDYLTGEFYGNVEGSTNNDVAPDYSGWIDLFKFGTSGYNHGARCYQPWSTDSYNNNYYAYGRWNANLYDDDDGQADWGYNPISNGGNQEHQWRTLRIEEWEYVLFTRSTLSNARFSKAKVNGVNGMILLPDGWLVSIFPLNNIDEPSAGFDSNDISLSQWDDLFEPNGAVFMPVTGYRTVGSIVNWPWSEADYSSSSYFNEERAHYMYFGETGVHAGDGEWQTPRYVANAVRLVQDAN